MIANQIIAGAMILKGDFICIGNDGMAYPMLFPPPTMEDQIERLRASGVTVIIRADPEGGVTVEPKT
jgi:hypothetical protein